MIDPYASAVTLPLTPRQDRLEASIGTVLRAGGTRSELRELVYQLTDFLRMQGIAMEDAVTVLTRIAGRAGPSRHATGEHAVGESATDRLTMMIRWCASRYQRGD